MQLSLRDSSGCVASARVVGGATSCFGAPIVRSDGACACAVPCFDRQLAGLLAILSCGSNNDYQLIVAVVLLLRFLLQLLGVLTS